MNASEKSHGGRKGEETLAVRDAENRKDFMSIILLTNEVDYPMLSGR